MVTQKALPSYMPVYSALLLFFPSGGKIYPFPLNLSLTCELLWPGWGKTDTVWLLCPGLGTLSYQVRKKNNSLACWREGTGSQQPQGMTEHRKRDPGGHNRCSLPSRISRHASHTSLMPATPSQVALANTCGPEASHCHCALPILQNCEQKNGSHCFKPQSFESFIVLQ